MTDSVTGGLLNGGASRTSLCDLPSEMLWSIFSHSNLVSLMRLSATSHIMRYQVHEYFTSRIEAQAKKYPEVKQSLDRIGWKKKHNSWDCKCFKMMAGPCFTWSELEEQKSFSVVCDSELSKTSTNSAGKTFFVTSSSEVTYAEMAPGVGGGHNSLQTLVTFDNSVYDVVLVSYDNVLAVFLQKSIHLSVTVSVCIFNASTLVKVSELNLYDEEDVVAVRHVAITRDTMAVHLHCINLIQEEIETKIQIWKINTQDPHEKGIALLHIMSHHTAPISQEITHGYQTLCINDRFTVIFDDVVKVFERNGETTLVCQLEIGNKRLKAMAIQWGQGDHLAVALRSVNADNVPELTVKVYSASSGNLIVQKELGPFRRWSAPFFMKWFGDHLTIGLQQFNTVSMFSWQPGLASFLNSPCRVPVVRRSSRKNRGGVTMWDANCLYVDFQGITTAVCNTQTFYGFKKVFFKTWKSAS